MAFHDFAAAWVYYAWSVSIFCFRWQIAYYAEACVVYIHIGILRPFLGGDGILEACLFERFVPVVYSGYQVWHPFLWGSWVNVIYYLFLRLAQLSFAIAFRVFRFQPITLYYGSMLGDLLLVRELSYCVLEISHSFICKTGAHRLFRKHYYAGVKLDGYSAALRSTGLSCRCVVGAHGNYLHIDGEGLYGIGKRAVGCQRADAQL